MNEQKKTLKREIQTIIKKKMVEFCATIKKKESNIYSERKSLSHLRVVGRLSTNGLVSLNIDQQKMSILKVREKMERKLTEPLWAVCSVVSNSWRPRGL